MKEWSAIRQSRYGLCVYWCCVGHRVKCPVLIAFPLNFPVNIDDRFVLQSYNVIRLSVSAGLAMYYRYNSQTLHGSTDRNLDQHGTL